MGIHAGDRNLVTVPLAHSYGFDNVVLALALLGTPAILTADLTPLRLLTVARTHGATVLPSVPFLLELLSRSAARGAIPTRRLVVSAGAPLPRETRERFHAGFGVRPRTFYGSTECGGISFDREAAAISRRVVGTQPTASSWSRRRRGRTGRSPSPALRSQRPCRRGVDGPKLSAAAASHPDVGRIDERGRLHLLGRASTSSTWTARHTRPRSSGSGGPRSATSSSSASAIRRRGRSPRGR
jgi:acyl-coenzyme A synthetase/AMP-(fatty) acid ligase